MNIEKQIDATLRRIAHAEPPAGLEERIRMRLQHPPAPSSRLSQFARFFLGQKIYFTAAASAMACVLIVAGSVQHSRRQAFPATGVHLAAPGSGLGAASGEHIAPAPVLVPQQAHSRAEHKDTAGRATVSRNAHKPKGVAVPESTEPEKP